jgi:hypothetical protein
MGTPTEPSHAKLFASILFSEESILREGMDALIGSFGRIDWISDRLPFDFTNYYAREMGTNLSRHYVTFRDLVPMEHLPEIKHETNRIEQRFATPEGSRRLNIDPGYLCPGHVILATTKGYSHRPYLRNGIYADLTLVFRNRSFQALEWTYPDYRQGETIGLFNEIRIKYVERLNAEQESACSNQ